MALKWHLKLWDQIRSIKQCVRERNPESSAAALPTFRGSAEEER